MRVTLPDDNRPVLELTPRRCDARRMTIGPERRPLPKGLLRWRSRLMISSACKEARYATNRTRSWDIHLSRDYRACAKRSCCNLRTDTPTGQQKYQHHSKQ